MDIQAIFGLQFLLSIIVWSLIAKWLLAPWLGTKPTHEALFWLAIPHAFRYIGMVFLVPGVVSSEMPSTFATLAGYGDLSTGVIAMLALIALRYKWVGALALVWIFNIVGTVDLLNALPRQAAVPYFEAAWYIPTFLVPLLLVTHVMIFARLLRKK
ncbi:MAG: hypothetical protein IH914_04445 [candidate division Zixibacteria bacterium]|nr:hypothetical protein [candidate division Zixibacteria bacterium]